MGRFERVIANFDHASHSIKGSREYQEDACAFAYADAQVAKPSNTQASGAKELIAVLADGMGGHIGGARASNTACSRFITAYSEAGGLAGHRLQSALDASNTAIAVAIRHDYSLDGMGCTLIGASFTPKGLRWVSVGDSLLFLYRDRELIQLNEDHSLAPIIDLLAEKGELDTFEAKFHPKRNFLRSALTGSEIELVDLKAVDFPLLPDDWVIIASDGILTLEHDKIAAVIEQNRDQDAQAVVDALVFAIQQASHPNQDNATIMAIQPCFVTYSPF